MARTSPPTSFQGSCPPGLHVEEPPALDARPLSLAEGCPELGTAPLGTLCPTHLPRVWGDVSVRPTQGQVMEIRVDRRLAQRYLPGSCGHCQGTAWEDLSLPSAPDWEG